MVCGVNTYVYVSDDENSVKGRWSYNLANKFGRTLKWILCLIFAAFIVLLLLLLREHRMEKRRYDHFFISRSFYYPMARGFGNGDSSAVVILLDVDKSIVPETLDPVCEFQLSNGSWSRTKAEVRAIHDAETSEGCRLRNYRFLCHSLERTYEKVEAGEKIETPAFKLQIRDGEPAEMPLVRADEKRRTLVICPGRMFAFDMWHLFLLSMELHRLHQVDLVVIYIQSIDPRVYELVKEYALEDWVEIRYSLHMPDSAEGLAYNPNSETTWNNQLVNFHDCLYEFRESAEFIAFPDWDDLMMPGGADKNLGNSIRPLGTIFEKLALQEPTTASFLYYRTAGYYKKLEDLYRDEINANIDDIAKNTVQSLSFSSESSIGGGKVVVRPLFTDGIQTHISNLREGFQEHRIPWNQTFIIHARNHGQYKSNGTFINATLLEEGIKALLSRSNISEKVPNLPAKEQMLDTFNSCLGDGNNAWINIFNKVKDSKDYRCYNYGQCNLEMPTMKCINVKTTWTQVQVVPQKLYYSYFTKAEFEVGTKCTI